MKGDAVCVAWLLWCSWLFDPCNASRGDKLATFRFCVQNCDETGCVKLLRYRSQKTEAFLNCPQISSCDNRTVTHSWTYWSCHVVRALTQEDCRYLCMREQEVYQRAKHRPVLKYYGKWPFYRLLGCQEFFSVAFSIGNLLIHTFHFYHLSKERSSFKWLWRQLWRSYALLSMNSWIASALFHSRDTLWTQAYDYISADLVIVAGFYLALLHCCHIKSVRGMQFVGMLCGVPLVRHILYLLLVKFDHRLNLTLCLMIGFIQSLLWLSWVYRIQHPARGVVYSCFVALYAAVVFEIVDFPPLWNLLDGHALWHAWTIPIQHFWYGFVHKDLSTDAALSYTRLTVQ